MYVMLHHVVLPIHLSVGLTMYKIIRNTSASIIRYGLILNTIEVYWNCYVPYIIRMYYGVCASGDAMHIIYLSNIMHTQQHTQTQKKTKVNIHVVKGHSVLLICISVFFYSYMYKVPCNYNSFLRI